MIAAAVAEGAARTVADALAAEMRHALVSAAWWLVTHSPRGASARLAFAYYAALCTAPVATVAFARHWRVSWRSVIGTVHGRTAVLGVSTAVGAYAALGYPALLFFFLGSAAIVGATYGVTAAVRAVRAVWAWAAAARRRRRERRRK